MSKHGWLLASALVICAVVPLTGSQAQNSASQAYGQPSTARGDWPLYSADPQGTRYSPLGEINAANFNSLEIAWRVKTDLFGPHPEYKLEGTPLEVNGTVYTTAGTRRNVIALDARTGELKWSFGLDEGERAALAPRQLSGCGVSYWTARAMSVFSM